MEIEDVSEFDSFIQQLVERSLTHVKEADDEKRKIMAHAKS